MQIVNSYLRDQFGNVESGNMAADLDVKESTNTVLLRTKKEQKSPLRALHDVTYMNFAFS